MKKIDRAIDLSTSFELLNDIRNISNGIITSKELSTDHNIELHYSGKELRFIIFYDSIISLHKKWSLSNLTITKNELQILVPFLTINTKTWDQIQGKIPAFDFGNFENNQPKYHRLALNIDQKINFTFTIENVGIEYNYKLEIHSRNAIEIVINNKVFYLFLASKKLTELSDDDYLVIEAELEMEYEEFSNYCFSILISFGYISGHFINDNGYFLQYENKKMTDPTGIAYRQFRGSIKCMYLPIYSNPSGYINETTIANTYIDKVRTLSLNEFSKLCELCYLNEDIKTVLLLLIEVNKQTLVSSPGTLSIALETLSKVISAENKLRDRVKKTKKLKDSLKELKTKLEETVAEFEGNISKEEITIIKKRIQHIDQPSNKNKLLTPFKILNIPLEDSDIQAINQRNAFLHGSKPMVQNTRPKSINEEDRFRYYLHLKLYVLISSIILKYVGYDSTIVNHPKINEKSTGIKLEEDHFRQI